MVVMQAFGKQLGGGGSRPSKRFRYGQDDADRLRRAARQLERAAQNLSTEEGGDLVVKLACDLRKQAQEIEKWLPSES